LRGNARGVIVRHPTAGDSPMLPASDLSDILANLAALNLQPNTAAPASGGVAGSPAITLGVYGHLFKPDDRAAAIMEKALG